MIFDMPFYEPNICEKVNTDMNQYPGIPTPPTDDGSPMYLYTPSSTGMYQSSNIKFNPNGYLTSDRQNIILDISAPMLIDETSSGSSNSASAPYLTIIEQPVDKFRFRYKSEMSGTHGSLNGQNNDKTRKVTYPTVQLCNYDLPAVVRCSIYQIGAKDKDIMPHAHRLVRKHGSREEVDDPHDIGISPEVGFQAVFKNMGIIHTAKKNIVSELVKKKTKLKKEKIARDEGRYRELTTREEVEIKGLAESESKSINLNVVCLRFDAFYLDNGIYYPIAKPVYSHGINNLKSALTGELKIVRMDHCTSPAKGGLEIFILVERVTKKNIKIRFFELDESDVEVWWEYGKFSDLDVHHQYAIVFKTPPYKDKHIMNPVRVFIELVRPSDNSRSEPKEFTYVPSSKPGGKRPRIDSYSSNSYSSNSFSSQEVPQTVEEIKLNKLMTNTLELTSEELFKAAKDIDSDEFNHIFNSNFDKYLEGTEVSDGFILTSNSIVNATDAGTENSKESDFSEKVMAMRAFSELKAFIANKPEMHEIVSMLKHYLDKENMNNALHVFIKENNETNAFKLISLIRYCNLTHFFNMRNQFSETPIYLATVAGNLNIVKVLVRLGADVSIPNMYGNTVLHYAIENCIPLDLLEALLTSDSAKEILDAENNDGDTPLQLAIENKNISSIKMLCKAGANINKRHKKSGYTPLRMAVESQDIDLVRCILAQDDIDPEIEDFQNVKPIQAAADDRKIHEAISEYMQRNGYSNVDVKEETLEDISDEEMDCGDAIKEEKRTAEDIEDAYDNVEFTEDCLNRVSEILDNSGNYRNLAELLDLSFLLRSDFLDGDSPSKELLSYAERTGETVYHIRNFLENLDEIEAVRIIDEMVRNSSK